MAAGETSSNFGMAQRWTAAGGTHQITALVDDINRFEESNESNNSHAKNLDVGDGSTMPDVYIEDLWWTPSNPQPGQDVQFYVRVRNGGNAGTGAEPAANSGWPSAGRLPAAHIRSPL
jgi:subtilase family serine protease